MKELQQLINTLPDDIISDLMDLDEKDRYEVLMDLIASMENEEIPLEAETNESIYTPSGEKPIIISGGTSKKLSDNLDGATYELKGRTHKKGGIKMMLPEDAIVYSDKLKIEDTFKIYGKSFDKKSFKEASDFLSKKENKIIKTLKRKTKDGTADDVTLQSAEEQLAKLKIERDNLNDMQDEHLEEKEIRDYGKQVLEQFVYGGTLGEAFYENKLKHELTLRNNTSVEDSNSSSNITLNNYTGNEKVDFNNINYADKTIINKYANQPVEFIPQQSSINYHENQNYNFKKQDDLMLATFNSFKNAGLTDNQAFVFLGQIGRENSFNLKTLFGEHKDDANNKANLGIISFQKERRNNLVNFIKENGGEFEDKNETKLKPTVTNLDLMTKFIINEIQSEKEYSPTRVLFLGNPNVDIESGSNVLSTNYIRWRATDPKFNTKGWKNTNDFLKRANEVLKLKNIKQFNFGGRLKTISPKANNGWKADPYSINDYLYEQSGKQLKYTPDNLEGFREYVANNIGYTSEIKDIGSAKYNTGLLNALRSGNYNIADFYTDYNNGLNNGTSTSIPLNNNVNDNNSNQQFNVTTNGENIVNNNTSYVDPLLANNQNNSETIQNTNPFSINSSVKEEVNNNTSNIEVPIPNVNLGFVNTREEPTINYRNIINAPVDPNYIREEDSEEDSNINKSNKFSNFLNKINTTNLGQSLSEAGYALSRLNERVSPPRRRQINPYNPYIDMNTNVDTSSAQRQLDRAYLTTLMNTRGGGVGNSQLTQLQTNIANKYADVESQAAMQEQQFRNQKREAIFQFQNGVDQNNMQLDAQWEQQMNQANEVKRQQDSMTIDWLLNNQARRKEQQKGFEYSMIDKPYSYNPQTGRFDFDPKKAEEIIKYYELMNKYAQTNNSNSKLQEEIKKLKEKLEESEKSNSEKTDNSEYGYRIKDNIPKLRLRVNNIKY